MSGRRMGDDGWGLEGCNGGGILSKTFFFFGFWIWKVLLCMLSLYTVRLIWAKKNQHFQFEGTRSWFRVVVRLLIPLIRRPFRVGVKTQKSQITKSKKPHSFRMCENERCGSISTHFTSRLIGSKGEYQIALRIAFNYFFRCVPRLSHMEEQALP